MATNRKAKVVYLWSPWSDFNDFGVYTRIFKVSQSVVLVFKMIVDEGHSQKVILKAKFEENVSSKGFLLSDTRLR